jgi:hypothetical protein
MANKAYVHMYIAKETYVHGKRDLRTWQTRPNDMANKAYVHMYIAKETCVLYLHVHSKRDLCTDVQSKRDLAKETYVQMNIAKETYVHGKRDLRTWQKRPTYICTKQKRPPKALAHDIRNI